ncbi:hypothetical protein [Cognatiluteimonas telluris]|jgi:hypothetical protein|uniref:hypothetical protein n=1 Tax=Cognatiluteimonas telluris TaxID=1104775 RepID=UPI001407CD9B|nr:hypothetical protein [Lysobacter telluris]
MGNDHEQRRADTIPALDRSTTGNSPNSRSGKIEDTLDRDARRADRMLGSVDEGGERHRGDPVG